MMWLSSLLLLVAFSSVLCQVEDEFKQCVRGIEELDLEQLEKESGEVQMEAICPEILGAFRCVDEIFERELSITLEEIADIAGDSDDLGKILRVAVNTKNMLTDFCTEGSQLNIDVKADMQCFESIDENDAAEKCKEKGTVLEVLTDISNEIEGANSGFDSNKVCQEAAFMAACISHIVHDTCGQRAFNTFNSMLKRSTVFPNMLCSPGKLEEMKNTLIDTLDMPDAEKEVFKMGLDLRRRRK